MRFIQVYLSMLFDVDREEENPFREHFSSMRTEPIGNGHDCIHLQADIEGTPKYTGAGAYGYQDYEGKDFPVVSTGKRARSMLQYLAATGRYHNTYSDAYIWYQEEDVEVIVTPYENNNFLITSCRFYPNKPEKSDILYTATVAVDHEKDLYGVAVWQSQARDWAIQFCQQNKIVTPEPTKYIVQHGLFRAFSEYVFNSHRILISPNMKIESSRVEYDGGIENAPNVSSLIHYAWENLPRPNEGVLSDCCQIAANKTRNLSMNWLTQLYELLTLKKGVSSYIDNVLSLGNSRDIADLYLSSKYGIKMTYSDLKDIAEAVLNPNLTDHVSGRVENTITDNFRVEPWTWKGYERVSFDYSPYITKYGTPAFVSRNNLIPDLTDLWDMVPYSFLVDWFLPIGDIIQNIDDSIYMDSLRVYNIWYTRKYRTSQVTSSANGPITITFTFFERQSSGKLYPPRIMGNFDKPSAEKHIVEESALLIQRL